MNKEEIDNRIRILKSFTLVGYFVKCKEFEGERKALDAKREQMNDEIYFLESLEDDTETVHNAKEEER